MADCEKPSIKVSLLTGQNFEYDGQYEIADGCLYLNSPDHNETLIYPLRAVKRIAVTRHINVYGGKREQSNS